MTTPAAPPPESSSEPASLKERLEQASNGWLAKNRSLVLRQTPVWAQSLAALLISLGTIAVVGGYLFKIDEVVTVQGQLTSTGGNREVKTPAGGKVAAVYFKDNEVVRKGQVLVRFDTRQAADEQATLTRLIALEQQDLQSKLTILAGRLDVLEAKLNTQESITQELGQLVSSGGFQRIQYLQELDKLLELRDQVANTELEKRRAQLETAKSIGQMRNRLRNAELQLQYQTVVAPVDGVVFDPQASPQGVLEAGARILTIVPQRGLQAEVFVQNKDIGFVDRGQKAKVRVDAFPFARYGELQGKVVSIGADALPPDQEQNYYRFPVKITLNRSFLQTKDQTIPLQAGMAVSANLKLREKRVISLISDMLVDQTDSLKSLRQQ
jgi:hemolysin D